MATTKLFILVAVLGLASAYRHGAPASACGSLKPRHKHYRPQTDDAPYELILSRDNSTPEWSIKVTLKGNTENNDFLGFLVQAREDQAPIGKFTVLREFSDISQLLTCENRGVSC